MNGNASKTWVPIDFTIYFSFIKWLVIADLLIEILIRWLTLGTTSDLMFDRLEIMMWIFRILILGLLGWRTLKNFGHSLAVAALSGALAGLIIGLVIALFRFFEGVKIWKFFNLITETTLTAALGALVSILVVFALSLKSKY